MQNTDQKQQNKSNSSNQIGEMNLNNPFLTPIDEPDDKDYPGRL